MGKSINAPCIVVLQATITREHAEIASGLIIAVALQVYIIFRVRGRMSNNALQPSARRSDFA